MPSFSFLKRSKKKTPQPKIETATPSAPAPPQEPAPVVAPPAINVVNNNNNNTATAEEKISRRRSKRDFIRSFLKPAGSNSVSAPQKSETIAETNLQVPPKPAASVPTSPAANQNKPLPPPPPPGAPEPERPAKVSVQLKRIISPLTVADIRKLFSGAPQFYARSQGYHSGPPHPSVAFPWNQELEIRDLSDHGQIEDIAWGCVTTTPHIIRKQNKGKDKEKEKGNGGNDKDERQKARFLPRAKERPNMLSFQGLERGTVGFQAALEVAVADALHEAKEIDFNARQELRRNFLREKKHGLRPLGHNAVVKKLMHLGTAYHEDPNLLDRTTVEMYSELFTQVLFPPTRVTDSNDPYSLHVQIEALVAVLNAPDIWVDFSNVEWRIRLGQMLWGPPQDPTEEDEIRINGETIQETQSQQFWLLFQILLSCELVIRLDAVSKNAEIKSSLVTVEEIARFEKEVTRSVKWSILLARLWLENIRVTQPEIEITEEEKPASGWLASIANAVTQNHEEHHHHRLHHHAFGKPEFHGRHPKRQAAGLVHFARKLQWPDADAIAEKFATGVGLEKKNGSDSSTSVITPAIGTPLSMTTQRSPYFGGLGRPGLRRGLSKQKMSAMFHPSGWLSKSYLTGLILPGEGLSHFLISTLLENDDLAVSRLGEDANLYGGFVYAGKSFWSTACIIGRVLAAGKGVSECMGWLSSGVLPKGVKEGWVNVDVELEPRSDGEGGPDTARIWKKQLVERDSYVLGDGDASSILPGDFTLPDPDVPDPIDLNVTLESLDLFASVDSIPSSKPSTSGNDKDKDKETPETETTDEHPICTYSAMMRFSVEIVGHGTRDMNLALTYDSQFVTAHPCVPNSHSAMILSPTNPDTGMTVRPQLNRTLTGPHALFTGHPLHKSYTFSRHTLSSVITASPTSPPPLLSLHTDSKEIFVIDCTEPCPPESSILESQHPAVSAGVSRKKSFGSDLEMLARAWCAEMGYNALVSRRGRNCISCSVREARALSWKIVLRFG